MTENQKTAAALRAARAQLEIARGFWQLADMAEAKRKQNMTYHAAP